MSMTFVDRLLWLTIMSLAICMGIACLILGCASLYAMLDQQWTTAIICLASTAAAMFATMKLSRHREDLV